MINSDKGELAQNVLSSFINFMLVNFYDDLYLTASTKCPPILNIDDIIFLPTIDISLMQQQGNDNLIHKKLFENVENRVDKFLSKDIMFSKQTNCLQFTKYYQNMWRSMRYLENMVHDIGSITCLREREKDQYNNLTKKIQFCYEKLLNYWDKQSPNYKSVSKFLTLQLFVPIYPNVSINIEVSNIEKTFALLSTYDFSVYRKIMHNKLLLQTFEDCQYFDEPIDNSSQNT